MNFRNGQLNLWLDFHSSGRCSSPLLSSPTEASLVTRFQIVSSAFIAASILVGATLPASASVYEDAKKVCLERFNDEQKSGSVPKGMNKSRYLAQCQKSYVRSVQLENELNNVDSKTDDSVDGSNAQSKDGQGGPEILPPATTPKKPAKTSATKPLPRFKPAV